MILLFVQLNFTQVVDKTECTNYSHIHCIVYLVIGRSSQDSYPFTSFATAVGHANFRAHYERTRYHRLFILYWHVEVG